MAAKWGLITGVSPGGMGEGHAIALLKRGINVIATSIDIKLLDDVKIEDWKHGARIEKLELNVTSPESIATAVEQVTKITGGRLDLLLNNAGYGYLLPLLDCDLDKARKQYEVNVWGVLAMTQAFFPLLKEAKGTIVNQASMAGVQGYNRPYCGIYSSSKAAVYSLSDCLRVELAPFDINVITLVTGSVKTEFFSNKEGGRSVTLPPQSPYNPIREKVEGMLNSSLSGAKGHDRVRVAESTLAAVLRHPWLRTRYIRRGFGAFKYWLIHLLFPMWLIDRWARQSGSLDVLRRIVKSK